MYKMHRKFVVAGVSGAGKSSLLKMLEKVSDNVTLHLKDTTRKQRPGEAEDNSPDLAFLADAEFDRNRRQDAYDVVYERYGNLYGVRRDQILNAVRKKDAHFIIVSDIPSIGKFKYMYPDARAIYVHVDPRDISEHTQKREGVEKADRLKRLERAYQEFLENSTLFDHVVLNFWEPENAIRQFRNILHFYARNAADHLRG